MKNMLYRPTLWDKGRKKKKLTVLFIEIALWLTTVSIIINKDCNAIYTYIPLTLYHHLRCSTETPMFYKNYLAMSNTADVTGGKLIAVWLQSISGVSAVNPLVAFYNMHGRKRGAILLLCPGHHMRPKWNWNAIGVDIYFEH
jgi:hypothetical protein